MGLALQSEIERAEQLLGASLTRSTALLEKSSIEKLVAAKVTLFERAAIDSDKRRTIMLRVVVVWILSIALALTTGIAPILALPVMWVLLEYGAVKRLAAKRAENFERDYTAMLLSLASAIRTGLDPLSALLGLPELFTPESEVAKELNLLKERVECGAGEEDALRLFAKTIDHPDVRLFTTAFILSRREGASLAECLQRLARVTRQRQSFRRKVRSAVAMQKLSAMGIAMCTVAIGVIQAISNPTAIKMTIEHPIGVRLVMGGGFLIVCGILWMMRIANPRV